MVQWIVFYIMLGVRDLRRNDSLSTCHRIVGKWWLEKLFEERRSKAKADIRQTCKDIRKCKIINMCKHTLYLLQCLGGKDLYYLFESNENKLMNKFL